MDTAREATKKYYKARANTINLSDVEDSYEGLAHITFGSLVLEDTATSGAKM